LRTITTIIAIWLVARRANFSFQAGFNLTRFTFDGKGYSSFINKVQSILHGLFLLVWVELA